MPKRQSGNRKGKQIKTWIYGWPQDVIVRVLVLVWIGEVNWSHLNATMEVAIIQSKIIFFLAGYLSIKAPNKGLKISNNSVHDISR